MASSASETPVDGWKTDDEPTHAADADGRRKRDADDTAGLALVTSTTERTDTYDGMQLESDDTREAKARAEAEQKERERTIEQLRVLSGEAQLPFLDRLLLDKYMCAEHPQLTPREQQAMAAHVVDVLKLHRAATVRCMRAVDAREKVMVALDAVAAEADAATAGHAAENLDLQAQGLRHLYQLRQATIAVVEAIVAWRALLTRPFAFAAANSSNYILKIAIDSARLDRGGLAKLLPLQLTRCPLMTNVPALNLFGPGADDAAPRPGSSGNPPPKAYPMKRLNRTTAPPLDATEHKRLVHAEEYVLGELDGQLALHRELLDLCTHGLFVPVLNVPRVIPCGAAGLPLVSTEWLDRVQRALLASLQSLLEMPGIADVGGDDDDDGDGEDDAGDAAPAAADGTAASTSS